MSVVSFNYLLFLLIVVLVYYVFPRKYQWVWLLVSSLVFFCLACTWKMLFYLAYGVAVTYCGAMYIEKSNSTIQKKFGLICTLILILPELAVLKYSNFFASTGNIIGSIFNVDLGWQPLSLLAPIGISYYTLSIIGYVIDVYRGMTIAQHNICKHALFTCYFPQMTSGPIVRYDEMQNQYFCGYSFDYNQVKFGAERILYGYFKKLVIADRVAILVSNVYADYYTYSGAYVLLAVFGFFIQLYMDFSGCMDIIMGSSEMLGIKLPENFNTPFASGTLSEFWRRWHITLGVWTKDYILYPLLKSDLFQKIGAKSRKRFGKKIGKSIPTYLGLLVVWFSIGLWHGGSYKFIFASGLIPGCLIILGNAFAPLFNKITGMLKIRKDCFSYRLFERIRTISLMCISLSLISAKNLTDGLRAIKSGVTTFNPWIFVDGSVYNLGLDIYDICVLAIALLVVLLVGVLHERGIHIRTEFLKQNLAFQWIVLLGGIFAVLIFGIYGPGYDATEFIYKGF